MNTTIATILGTAALGLLKGQFGSSSSVRVIRENKYFFIMPEFYLRFYATTLDFLGLNIDELYNERVERPIEDIKEHRVFLHPIENSPIIKSVGLYLTDTEISDDDPGLDILYSVYCKFVIETYDNNLVLDEQIIQHIQDISSDILSALQQLLIQVAGGEDVYSEDEWTSQFDPTDSEQFYDFVGEPFRDNIHLLRRVSEDFIIYNNGHKVNLREFQRRNPTSSKYNLRKR